MLEPAVLTSSFTEHDLVVHHKTIRRRWMNLFLTFVVLWGIYGLALTVKEVREQYQLVMLPFLFPSLFFLAFCIPGFIRLYKDGKAQQKYCGTFLIETATFKGDKSTSYYLYIFVNDEKRKVTIRKSELEQVQSETDAYVEFSQHACTIFKFNQLGREIVFRQS